MNMSFNMIIIIDLWNFILYVVFRTVELHYSLNIHWNKMQSPRSNIATTYDLRKHAIVKDDLIFSPHLLMISSTYCNPYQRNRGRPEVGLSRNIGISVASVDQQDTPAWSISRTGTPIASPACTSNSGSPLATVQGGMYLLGSWGNHAVSMATMTAS